MTGWAHSSPALRTACRLPSRLGGVLGEVLQFLGESCPGEPVSPRALMRPEAATRLTPPQWSPVGRDSGLRLRAPGTRGPP